MGQIKKVKILLKGEVEHGSLLLLLLNCNIFLGEFLFRWIENW